MTFKANRAQENITFFDAVTIVDLLVFVDTRTSETVTYFPNLSGICETFGSAKLYCHNPTQHQPNNNLTRLRLNSPHPTHQTNYPTYNLAEPPYNLSEELATDGYRQVLEGKRGSARVRVCTRVYARVRAYTSWSAVNLSKTSLIQHSSY